MTPPPAASRPQPATPPLHYGPLHATASTLRLLVAIVFVFTFLVQPFRIPSASMEPTLLVGDFLLVNKVVFAPPTRWASALLPYRNPRDGDIIVFHFPENPPEHVIKRILGRPGDRIHLRNGRVYRNGKLLVEPYALYLPAYPDRFRDDFPAVAYNYPGPDYHGWLSMQQDVRRGNLYVPPGDYFVMGDDRNDSRDSRYWGFVPRRNIVGPPVFIYFSLREPSGVPAPALPSDKLGQKSGFWSRLFNFARWDRIFRPVH
ncbi:MULTISPECIES: signal peptidase I [Acidobacterium]|uniref:Signal peptidase I n=1 Tax=Acidobacterium capsulatum (strain ATCC 51196 / DSM 11244 / BCRC 80197 / JCM 7670 / NBRC 15755 / NCIMB 13165 / 161) TaxID=240015 RepID=C1F8X8_ACIC5|nr:MULTISPECIES: signal peptidase I [Acidobacterium]ACO33214.1 signal peptidase I [Acidobacterium capsulatum ATCC 51196]HCT59900.1 signal peptidase I [Acidobacterium sp.]